VVEISYHHDLKEVQGDPVLAGIIAARAYAPFDRLEWWQGLVSECGLKPMIVVAREGDDIAILPLQAGTGHLRALGNWYNFWTAPVYSESGGIVPRAIELMTAIFRDLQRQAWRITLEPLREEGWDTVVLTKAFAAAGWVFWKEPCGVNHYDAVGQWANYEEFLAARPGSLRTTLQRKARKVETTVSEYFSDEIWKVYETVYRASWKPEEGSLAFLERFAREEAAAGRLRLGIARQCDHPVAAQLWTVERGEAYIHKLAHREDAKSISPGTTLTAAMFRHVIEVDRAATVDFGTGDDNYKRDWVRSYRARLRIDAFDPLSPRAWPHMVRAKLRRRESLVSPAGAG
jgi:CelD/BcsL family acetyltransferase involved in cellulose biosynthesis